MTLSTSSNFAKPDDAFRAIVEAHGVERRTERRSRRRAGSRARQPHRRYRRVARGHRARQAADARREPATTATTVKAVFHLSCCICASHFFPCQPTGRNSCASMLRQTCATKRAHARYNARVVVGRIVPADGTRAANWKKRRLRYVAVFGQLSDKRRLEPRATVHWVGPN